MASIRALLKINEVGNGEIDSVTTNVETNNISVTPYTTDITNWFVNQTTSDRDYQGATVNIAGVSIYGTAKYGVKDSSNNRYGSVYNGMMYPTPSQLSENFKITIVGTNVIAFNIHFDNSMGQYPTEYQVYSSITGLTETFSNLDEVIRISNLMAGYGTTEITITQWNESNAPIGITFVENVEVDLTMDKYWIDSFETQSQMSTDASSVQYETLANTGSITLMDKRLPNGKSKLLEYSKLGYLNNNLYTLQLFINNRQVQEHISLSSPNYNLNNHTVKLELTNEIQKWNDIVVPEQTYNSNPRLYNVLTDILQNYIGYTNNQLSTLNVKILFLNSSNVEEEKVLSVALYNITYLSPTLQQDTALNILNKICQAMLLAIYLKDDNTLAIRSLRPRKLSDEKVIVIPFVKQYSALDYSIITDNKYDGVSFDNDTTYTSNKNILKIQSNEIIDNSRNTSTYYAKDFISAMILKDYAKGVKNATLRVFPSNFYYTDGTLAKNWQNGEIIEINDIIKILDENGNSAFVDINKQDTYFRVIDRKVVYEGQVLIELQLQEIIN